MAEWLGETLKIRVSAPPERGKANKAVEQLLAKTLGVSRNAVQVVAGKTSARKTVTIEGLTEEEVSERLSRELG